MAAPYSVKPDTEFLGSILDEGGEDLKKCFQCATCSVACELSNGREAFPRKEMIWAQWGLKDRLVADPAVWLCHQCNDCSTRCPRGARPGDVLAAVRRQCVEHYAAPRFLSSAVSRVKSLPLLLVIPAVLLLLALAAREPLLDSPLGGVLSLLHHEGFYADLYPHWMLIGFYSFFTGLAFLGALAGVLRFWRAMKASDEAAGRSAPTVGVVPSFIRTLGPIFGHGKFNKCERHGSRRMAHLGAFYGFVALFLVSVWAVVALYMINPLFDAHLHYPFAFWNPWKLLANVGAVILIAGCVKAILDRRRSPDESGKSTSFDWVFVWLLLSVGVTGLLTEVLRYAVDPGVYGEAHAVWTGGQYVAYAAYFVHLVVVFGLLVYLPYSKFAHVLYRTVAMAYAEHSGRSETEAGNA